MRLALVTNDASGGGTDARRVAELLGAAGAEVTLHTVDDAEARRDAAVEGAGAEAAARHPDRLVVASGDGSIARVAVAAAHANLPLAVIPTGTANDFARAMGIPLELERACALAADGGREQRVDILRAGDRPFLNAASAGLSVIAARGAPPLKRSLGALAYAAAALRAGLSGQPVRCVVSVDGRRLFAGEAWQVIVAGTGAFGGGSEVDAADPSDRLIDVAVIERGPRTALVRHAWAMRRGGLVEQPGVRHGRGRTVEIELPPGTPLNVDGEVCAVSPMRFSVDGERLRLVCP
jgi:diacylglycerol kinase (ATP)